MLTGDQNLIDIAYSVRWNIRTPELYLFQLAQPDETIREVAESAMRAVVSRVALNDAMGDRRADIEAQVAESMQRILDCYRSGIQVQGIAIKQADPPEAVNDAFKEVTAAQQDAQSYINSANAYALQLRQKAQGEATAFDKVYEQYKLAPEVTRRRMYYETMEQVLSKVDKTIVEAPGVTPYLPLPQVQKPQQPQERPAMMEFIRRRPLVAAVRRPSSAGPPARQLPDRSRDQAGGRRPLRQAGADPQPYKPGGRSARPAPGINWRIPFVEQLVWIDKRVLDVDMQRQQVLSTDQRRLQVDAFARYRIVDPLLMYIRAGTEQQLTEQLRPILGSEVRNELGQATFASLLTPERQGMMDNVRTIAQPDRPPIWRRDHRRPDQAHGFAGRGPAAVRVRKHAHRARAGSALDPRARRQAGADHPRRGRRRGRARPMRQVSARTRNSTTSTARCRAIRRLSSAIRTGQGRADNHHFVAAE